MAEARGAAAARDGEQCDGFYHLDRLGGGGGVSVRLGA